MSFWPCHEWKTKGNIFAYAHINIKYFDFSNDFYIFETDKVIKTQEKWKILNKTRSIYSKFC